VPRRSSDFRLEKLDDEFLLFHPAKAQLLYCNETASLIWQLCDGAHCSSEIISILIEAYPETARAISADVEETLKQFLEYGAIAYA
jgi:hypothetical protein